MKVIKSLIGVSNHDLESSSIVILETRWSCEKWIKFLMIRH